MTNPNESTLDPATVIQISDELDIGEAINPDGTRTTWILGNDNGTHGCNCPHCAPHDQLDHPPLPIQTNRRKDPA